MKLLFTLPAPTIYDAQNRAMSWKHTPTPRESLKRMRELLPRLKELGVTKVISSDLDEDTRRFLATKLDIPHEEWPALRRLNAGKNHGKPLKEVEGLWKSLERDEVPLKGGDSKASYSKRVAAARDRLARLDGTPLIIAGAREINAILELDATLERCRIYEVDYSGKSSQAL